MADDTPALLTNLKAKLPDGANILGGSDLSQPVETTTAGYKHKVLVIYPNKTIHELTLEEWPDGGFDILNDEQVGKVY